MTDNHIHFGQFEEAYYEPLEILRIVKDSGITGAAYSSTTNCREGVKYGEVYTEIAQAVSAFSPAIFMPYLWFVPSYLDEGITVEKAFSELPYKGIKIHPLANNWDSSDTRHERCLHELFAFAQDKHIPVLIHTGPNGVDAPGRFELFFGKYPEVKIILAHCRPVEEAVAMLKKYPNVYGDTAFVPEEWTRILFENDLGSKIITGSDFPITHYWAIHYPTNHCHRDRNDAITLQNQYRGDVLIMNRHGLLRSKYAASN
jgi:predicted TIM-barrel fold metal-dependent hydrolase